MNNTTLKSIVDYLREIPNAKEPEVLKNESDEEYISVSTDSFFTNRITIDANEEDKILIFSSETNLKVKKEIRKDFAAFISLVNNILTYGCYDFDIETGCSCFRLSVPYDEKTSLNALKNTFEYLTTPDMKYYHELNEFLKTVDYNRAVSRLSCGANSPFNPNKKKSAEIYRRVNRIIREIGWRCKSNEDKLTVSFDYLGEDIPMTFDISVNQYDKVLILKSGLPFLVRADKKKDLAVACCIVSNLLMDGCFSYNRQDDKIEYKMTYSFENVTVNESFLKYIISCSINTVEIFNDKLHALNKGQITMKQFIETVYNI